MWMTNKGPMSLGTENKSVLHYTPMNNKFKRECWQMSLGTDNTSVLYSTPMTNKFI